VDSVTIKEFVPGPYETQRSTVLLTDWLTCCDCDYIPCGAVHQFCSEVDGQQLDSRRAEGLDLQPLHSTVSLHARKRAICGLQASTEVWFSLRQRLNSSISLEQVD